MTEEVQNQPAAAETAQPAQQKGADIKYQ